MGNFKEDIARTRAFVFDVDGVLTDGGIVPIDGGKDFLRKYNAKDGYAVAYAVRRGYRVCIISGGRGDLLRSRMERLGVTRMYLNCMNKREALLEFAADYGIDLADTIYMGDDIVEASRYVSEFAGGRGAVRDIVEQTLRAQGEWCCDTMGVMGVASR